MRWVRNLPVVLLLAGLLAACSSGSSQSEPTASPTPTQTHYSQVKLFFVADTPRGFRLFPEIQQVVSSSDLAETVMSSLVSGQLQPLDPDYSNLWGNGFALNSITVTNGIATIDLALGKLNVGGEGELRAIDQLVWTVTEINKTITGVKFTVDGQTVESLAGHVDTTGTFTREPDYEVLNPVSIMSPSQSTVLVNPIIVSGEACTFEANVSWELLKDGVSINTGSTLAQAACPERSAWTVDLPQLASGTYTIVGREYSAKDGSLSAIDSKDFSVG
ncbi:MAG TPA: GerMN domain-containing protein [Candidatus Nanopelagicaceae bacterium]|nr:GerMN domain-containing protein [Candidatus Nanopelagicaceae bacterium]